MSAFFQEPPFFTPAKPTVTATTRAPYTEPVRLVWVVVDASFGTASTSDLNRALTTGVVQLVRVEPVQTTEPVLISFQGPPKRTKARPPPMAPLTFKTSAPRQAKRQHQPVLFRY